MNTIKVEIPLQWARVQNVQLQQIVSSLGIVTREGLPYLILLVLEESSLCPRRLIAYPQGEEVNEPEACYLGDMRIGQRKRRVYLAD